MQLLLYPVYLIEGTFTNRNLAPNDIKKLVDEVNKISHKAFGEQKDLIGRVYGYAAEFVFVSAQELKTEGRNGSKKVSFKTYFLKTVKRMRTAFDVCQPSGELEEESALAQCLWLSRVCAQNERNKRS